MHMHTHLNALFLQPGTNTKTGGEEKINEILEVKGKATNEQEKRPRRD